MKKIQEEFEDYLQAGFEPVLTPDGSFTFKQIGLEEEMHARGGALSETRYIYGEAIDWYFTHAGPSQSLEILSVGLGVGYNEVMVAESYEKHFGFQEERKLKVLSFESEKKLRELFLKRLEDCHAYPKYWAALTKASPVRITEILKKHLILKKDFGVKATKNLNPSVPRLVLFDAYSSKTSPELWGEDFLTLVLKKMGKGSVFVTYAATGALKRALKNTGFENLHKKGFLDKRESTLAVKK